MPDRLNEIRARLDAATPGPYEWHGCPPGDAAFLTNAPADIAWLLAEVERLAKRVAMYEVVKS